MKSFAVLLSASAVLTAVPAIAQQQPLPRVERPYRGLFGGGVGDAEQLLTVDLKTGGGYDHIISAGAPAGSPDSVDSTPWQNGGFGNFAAALGYSLNRERVTVAATLASDNYFYPGSGSDFFGSYSGSVGASFETTRKSRLAVHHRTTYQPYLTFGLFPQPFGLPGRFRPPTPDVGVEPADYLDSMSGIAYTHSLSRKVELGVEYSHQMSDFGDLQRGFRSHSGGGGVVYGLARGLDLRARYLYTGATYEGSSDPLVAGHNIDAGVDFRRALSFSRRLYLSFGTGSAVVSDSVDTRYRLTGHVQLTREIGRTWDASIAYVRDAGFAAALREPVFSDSLTIFAGGLVNRRLQLRFSAAAVIGGYTFTGPNTGFDSYNGTADLTVGLSRYLGLGASYSYYRYAFEDGAPLPAALSLDFDRQSAQVYFTTWLPLIHRARKPDATR